MQIEYKITTWQKIYIQNKGEVSTDDIIKILKEGEALDIYNLDIQCESYPILDTEEEMTVKENGGYSTIELFDDEHNLIWSNGL